MGDRTAYQLTIYDLGDPESEGAVIDVLNEYGLSREWGMGGGNITMLDFAEQYVDDSARLGIAADLASKLIDAAGNLITFIGWEDPVYEWLGSLTIHTADLGLYTHDCNADGMAVFTAEEVRRALVDPDGVANLVGEPWLDAIARYEAKIQTAVDSYTQMPTNRLRSIRALMPSSDPAQARYDRTEIMPAIDRLLGQRALSERVPA